MPTVLIVEDEELLARHTLAPLVRPFADSVIALNLAQALVLIDTATGPFLAVIADHRLGDGSGLTAIARARARWASIPCLLATGYIDEDTTNTAFDLRTDLICKPIEQARVRRFLSEAGARLHELSLIARIGRIVDAWRLELHLTDAEGDILERAASGEPRGHIATSRSVSSETIDKQVKSLLAKTGDKTLMLAAERLRRLAMDLSAS